MDAAEALFDMGMAALFVAGVAIAFAEVLARRADRLHGERLRGFKRAADTRAALARADRERARALGDCAFEAAEQQLAQPGRLCQMPSRDQVLADVSSATGEHDRIEDIPAIELLTFAAIVDGLRERPSAAADSEQAGGPLLW